MADQRIVASVTWGECPKVPNRPHLADMVLYEGAEINVDQVMKRNHHSLWRVREFICMYCGLHAATTPSALMIVDVPGGLRRRP